MKISNLDAEGTLLDLLDPISGKRMTTPVRGLACSHDSCFDLLQFLDRLERTKNFHCPVCGNPVSIENNSAHALYVDAEVREWIQRYSCTRGYIVSGVFQPIGKDSSSSQSNSKRTTGSVLEAPKLSHFLQQSSAALALKQTAAFDTAHVKPKPLTSQQPANLMQTKPDLKSVKTSSAEKSTVGAISLELKHAANSSENNKAETRFSGQKRGSDNVASKKVELPKKVIKDVVFDMDSDPDC